MHTALETEEYAAFLWYTMRVQLNVCLSQEFIIWVLELCLIVED